MNALPVALSLANRPALIVGGGAAALNRARLLAKTTADLRIVSETFCEALREFVVAQGISVEMRPFVAEDVAGCAAVFAATGDPAQDTRAAEAARAAGVPVNAVDRPEISSFLMPALVDRDPIVVAVSTGGAAPILAQRVRAAVERALPSGIGRLAAFAGEFKESVRQTIPDLDTRRRFWNRVFDGPIGADAMAGRADKARSALLRRLNTDGAAAEDGIVYIVGAGPGDPDLLTLKALRLLERADVIVHDRLIGPEILDLARRDAERVYVGKAKADHHRTQDQINDILLDQARRGRTVVRLKGGDPFIFGRGGEEKAYLESAGVAVEVVPGITAAAGCAAYAGIPLTHRALASSVTFVTGHDARDGVEPDWARLAAGRDTLVIYMGVSAARRVAAALAQGGRSPSTPVAIVENGTLPNQRVVTGSLAELADLPEAHGITGPAIIVVGEVAALANSATAAELWRAAAE